MSDEHDSWFKSAFGVDLGEAASKLKDEASAALGQATTAVSGVVQQVEGAVEGAIGGVVGAAGGVVKKVAGAVAPSGSSSGGSAGGTGSFPLSGSVGRGGKNGAGDVRAVQTALGIAADGQCGGGTIAAIEAFQRNMGLGKPDGRVDAGGGTERALAGGGSGSGASAAASLAKPAEGDENSGGVFDQALQGAKDLGGKVIKEVREDFDAAKAFGGAVIEGAEGLASDVKDFGGKLLEDAAGTLGGLGGGSPLLADIKVPVADDPATEALKRKAAEVEIDKLALDALRGLAFSAAGGAFSSYLFAVNVVNASIKESEDARKKAAQLKFEIVVAIGVVVLTPLTAGAAAVLAGSILTAPLVTTLERELPVILKRAGVGIEKNISATVAANEAIIRVAGKFSASDSQRILGEATKSLSKSVTVSGPPDELAFSKAYLLSLASAADSKKKALDPVIAAATTFGELIGIFNACVSNTPESYIASITKQVADFMNEIGVVLVGDATTSKAQNAPPVHGRAMFVKFVAFGRLRYARVIEIRNAVLGRIRPPIEYVFKAYVSQQFEATAEKSGALSIDVKLFTEPLPKPPPDAPIPTVDVKDLPNAPVNVKDLPDAPVPTVNAKDLPDAPVNVNDLPDARQ